MYRIYLEVNVETKHCGTLPSLPHSPFRSFPFFLWPWATATTNHVHSISFCLISFFDPFSLFLFSDLGKLPTACIISAFFGRFVCFYFWHTCTTRTNGTHLLSCLLAGLHKLWYSGIQDTSTWSKFGAHGKHGDVFLFSNLGAL